MDESAENLNPGISLYVHIPFCETKCPYCDFNTYQGIESLIDPYVEALGLEVRLWGQTLAHPRVNTIFFGGGTPSYISLKHIDRLLGTMADSFDVVPGAETTLEANPGDLSASALAQMRDMGVNRLSIGVQSLDDSLLSLLGRRHTAQKAIDACRLAHNAGYDGVNLDLMYGLPQQTMDQWSETLKMVMELGPAHLSLYCLTLEDGTPMEAWVRQGRLPEPDPDLAADMYEVAREALGKAGYHHYEISNWAKPGHECRHNMAYWLNSSYLGVGPGAHSYLHEHRFWNLKSPRLYIQRVHQWASRGAGPAQHLDGDALLQLGPVDGVEAVDPRLEMAETMFLGLRLLDGVSIEDIGRRFSEDPLRVYGPQVQELADEGLLERTDGVLRLTSRGCLLANQVFMRFL